MGNHNNVAINIANIHQKGLTFCRCLLRQFPPIHLWIRKNCLSKHLQNILTAIFDTWLLWSVVFWVKAISIYICMWFPLHLDIAFCHNCELTWQWQKIYVMYGGVDCSEFTYKACIFGSSTSSFNSSIYDTALLRGNKVIFVNIDHMCILLIWENTSLFT